MSVQTLVEDTWQFLHPQKARTNAKNGNRGQGDRRRKIFKETPKWSTQIELFAETHRCNPTNNNLAAKWNTGYKLDRIYYQLIARIIHISVSLVNNQIDAQFLMYVYFYTLHASGRHVSIIRRIIVSIRHLVYVTLVCRYAGAYDRLVCRSICYRLVCRSICFCIPDGHPRRVT